MAACAICDATAVETCDECSHRICKRHRWRDDGRVYCQRCAREERRARKDAIASRPGDVDPDLAVVRVHARNKAAWMRRKDSH